MKGSLECPHHANGLPSRWIEAAIEEPDRGEWVQTKILAPYWGFFSTGHFAGHERKFGRDFKDIFSEPYREFESRSVRQQVIDIT